MDMVDRVKKIIMSPAAEWPVIKEEKITVHEMFKQYAMILAAIPAVAGFIGRWLIGMSIMGITVRASFIEGLSWAILTYILSLIGIYVMGFIIDALAPTFGCQKDLNASMKISVFSMTAAWLAGIFSLIPTLSMLGIVGLYSLYLLYMGLREIKNVHPDKLVGYYVVILAIGIVVFVIIMAVTTPLGAYSGT